MAAYERRWVEAALNQASGVKSQTAKLLGINKDKMKYLCRKYELRGRALRWGNFSLGGEFLPQWRSPCPLDALHRRGKSSGVN